MNSRPTAPPAARERAQIEAEIQRDTDGLLLVGDLLLRRVPWERWPPQAKADLHAAIHPQGDNPDEAAKARALAWHLFRGYPEPDWPRDCPPSAEGPRIRTAERLRADLAGGVPLGAAIHLGR